MIHMGSAPTVTLRRNSGVQRQKSGGAAMQVLCVTDPPLNTWIEKNINFLLFNTWTNPCTVITQRYLCEHYPAVKETPKGFSWHLGLDEPPCTQHAASTAHTLIHLISEALLQLTSCIPQMKASVHRPLQQPMMNATLVVPFHVGPYSSKLTEIHHCCWPGCGYRTTTAAATRRAVNTWYTSRQYQYVKSYPLAAGIPPRPQSTAFSTGTINAF